MIKAELLKAIKAQQGKENTPVWMVGEQLKDMLEQDPAGQEIVLQDLAVPEMTLANCEKKIKAYADAHKTGNFACVTPKVAEDIIRRFYGIEKTEAAATVASIQTANNVISLEDFF